MDRDFVGYGRQRPQADWPGGARVAVQFVLNYEEGGERSVLEGDPHAETFLSEIINAPAIEDRHMSMESVYEYGSRVGVWRVLRLSFLNISPTTRQAGNRLAASACKKKKQNNKHTSMSSCTLISSVSML